MRSRGPSRVQLQTTPPLQTVPEAVEEEPDLLPLLLRYPGLPVAFTPKMHEIVRQREHLKHNRLRKALEGPFMTIYRTAGTDEEWVRALAGASVLMEARAVATVRQRRHYLEEERKRHHPHRYTVRPAHEQETTKMTQWTLQQVPGSGLPLAEIERLLDRAVELARHGAFTPRGPLKEVPGVPMVLPEHFQRRGWQTHWIDPRYPLLDVDDDMMVVRLV